MHQPQRIPAEPALLNLPILDAVNADRIHFDEFDWVEEHLMRGRDRLLFVNRPYRDARRVTPERTESLSTP